jgi:hypothetical protein
MSYDYGPTSGYHNGSTATSGFSSTSVGPVNHTFRHHVSTFPAANDNFDLAHA